MLRWTDLKADSGAFTGTLDVELAEGERIVSVERLLDGGYNTEYVRVWIAK